MTTPGTTPVTPAHQPIRMYLNVHCANETPEGLLIRTATEAFCSPPWVLGPKHAATHAYISWTHADGSYLGSYYRVDGDVPQCTVGSARDGSLPHRAWRLEGPLAAVEEARRAALALVGAPYDWGEIAAQLIPLPRLPVQFDLFKRAFICTRVAVNVADIILTAMRGPRGKIDVPNLYPESLAQWAERNLPVEFDASIGV